MAVAFLGGSTAYIIRAYSVASVRRPFYAPQGGVTSEPDSARVYIVVGTLLFFVGLVAFLVSKVPISIARSQANRLATEGNGPEGTQDTASAAQDLYARYRKRLRK
jgi:hypothetical protein